MRGVNEIRALHTVICGDLFSCSGGASCSGGEPLMPTIGMIWVAGLIIWLLGNGQ